jgi:cytoskeletal protein RodZ
MDLFCAGCNASTAFMVLPGGSPFLHSIPQPLYYYIILLHFARLYVSPVGDGSLAMSRHNRSAWKSGGILELSIVRISATKRPWWIFQKKTDAAEGRNQKWISSHHDDLSHCTHSPESQQGDEDNEADAVDYSRSAAHYLIIPSSMLPVPIGGAYSDKKHAMTTRAISHSYQPTGRQCQQHTTAATNNI